MLCISLFIIQGFQAVKQNGFHEDSNLGSMLYSIIFRIRLLSPEFFSVVLGNGLCEGLLMKRFTAMRNLACQRECMSLGTFTSTAVIQCLSNSSMKLSLMKFISSKNHGSQEKSSWWRHWNRTHLSYWFIWVCWKHKIGWGWRSLYDEEEQPWPHYNENIMKWRLRSQADQTHVHRSTGGDKGKKQSEAPHISKDLSPLSFFKLYFTSLSDLLVTETNRYHHQYLDRCDRTPNPLPDITKYFCSSNYCTNGPRRMWQAQGLLDKGRTILHTFPPEYHDTRLFLAHLKLLAFHRQWQRSQLLWQTV